MPRSGGSVTLTTAPQILNRPSGRAYAALGVLNSSPEAVFIAIGSDVWTIAGGFQGIVPLPVTTQPIEAYSLSSNATVQLTWYQPSDLDYLRNLGSSIVQAQTGTLTSATSLGTVAISSIEQPVELAYDSSDPLYVALVSTADSTPTPELITGTVATAGAWQQVASTGGTLLAAILSNTSSADALSWGLTNTNAAPAAAMFTQAAAASVPITFPTQLGLAGPLYLWVTSATAGASYGVVWGAA